MNEFDELFDQKPVNQQIVNQDDPLDEFHHQAHLQRRNGYLLAIYIFVSLIFTLASSMIINAKYPDKNAILDNLNFLETPAIAVSDSDDVDYPYIITFSGSLKNNSGIDLPSMWVNIEFFDENGDSYGVYTYSEENIAIDQVMSFSEDISTSFDPASYEISYGLDESSMFYTVLGLLPVLFTSILFLIVDKEAFAYDWKRFKANFKNHIGQVFSGIVMVYLALIIANIILQSLGVTGTSENEMVIQGLFSDDPIQLVLLFLLLCVFTPITEEIIFRKVLYNYVAPRTGDTIAIIISGAVFGLMHVITYGDFIQAIPYVFMGMIFGYIYFRSRRNIYVTIGVHFLNNLISYLIYVLMVFGIYTF